MKIFLIFLLFIILGGLLIYQNFFWDKGGTPREESSILKAGDYSLYIANQKRGYFIINLVSLAKKGYVIIYNNRNGNPGEIIGGTTVLNEGEHLNVPFNLFHPVSAGEKVFAVLHEDSGDGIFSPNLDTPIKDEGGNIIVYGFYIE